MPEIKCNLCGSDSYTVVFSSNDTMDAIITSKAYRITDYSAPRHLSIVKCVKCGLIFAASPPPQNFVRNNYLNMVDERYVEEETGRRLSARDIIDALKKFEKKGKLLDVGCAVGFLLDEARKDGWETYGVELSKWAVSYAEEKLKLAGIFHGSLKEAHYPDDYFDAVIMKDTIEHLIDPMNMLIEIRRVLKSDGIFCVNTPDIDSVMSKLLRAKWWGIKQSHLYFFSRRTLYKILNASGFKSIKIKTHARVFTLKYWVKRLKGYNKFLYKIFMFLIMSGAIKENLLRINFWDQIEIYAKKR